MTLRRRLVAAAALAAFLATAAPALAADGAQAVRATFDGYRAAVAAGQGGSAAALVTTDTQSFYEGARRAALEAGPEDFERMRLLEALLTLRLRAAMPREELAALDGAGVIAAAVERGLIGGGFDGIALGTVEIYGDGAIAEQTDAAGRPAGVWWRFARERGAWRVDLRPNLDAGEAMMRDRLRASGLTRVEFLDQLANNRR